MLQVGVLGEDAQAQGASVCGGAVCCNGYVGLTMRDGTAIRNDVRNQRRVSIIFLMYNNIWV